MKMQRIFQQSYHLEGIVWSWSSTFEDVVCGGAESDCIVLKCVSTFSPLYMRQKWPLFVRYSCVLNALCMFHSTTASLTTVHF